MEHNRFKVEDIGKMGLFGQGNCHGVSSTMAGFLYPLRDLLGLDLKYRGGYSFQEGETVSNDV